tara:strand:- start:5880 stop:6026 length:147 start_codon:yes stop_codon:yes gene_type:complete
MVFILPRVLLLKIEARNESILLFKNKFYLNNNNLKELRGSVSAGIEIY